MKADIQATVLLAYTPTGIAYPSTRYTYDGLMASLKEMAFEGIYSDGKSFKFYVSFQERNLDYGRTNLALFLAMAMTESISFDTCDEFNIDKVADQYAISNSCGQNSRSYQDEVCSGAESHMGCPHPVDTDMIAVSSGFATSQMGRAPPPFSCRPKDGPNDYAGYWNRRDGVSTKEAYANARGRVDLEGCCWWGRGALLTRGICNIGKLNYYLGKRAHDERGEGRFPTIDFCASPQATCASVEGFEDMRWITGFFEWIDRVQNYPDWDYIAALHRYVDGGMKDDSFIETVTSIFTRGCHYPGCSLLQVTQLDARKENFKLVLDIFGLPRETDPPTLEPTGAVVELPVTPRPASEILPPSLSLKQPSIPVAQPPSGQVAQPTTFNSPRPTVQGMTAGTGRPTRRKRPAENGGLIELESNRASLQHYVSWWAVPMTIAGMCKLAQII